MENWRRRHGGEFRDREAPRVRSDYRRRAQQETRELSVPTWEKRFCFLVGGMPWNRFLEGKRYVAVSDRVVEWDDSAGEQAFNDAKRRFWAKINNMPCDILPPDPDANIDAVDWDSAADPDLYRELELELERQRKILEEFLLCLQREGPAPPPAPEELLRDVKVEPTGWGDEPDQNPPRSDDWENNGWGDRQANEWGAANDNDTGGAGARFPAGGNYAFQGDRKYRRRGKNGNANANWYAAPHKYPLRQWNMKPSGQV